jgi:hypothetical protein
MSLLRLALGGLALPLVAGGPVRAEDVPVQYLVDQKALKAAVAGTELTFSLYTDGACSAQVFTANRPVESLVIERLVLVTPKGARKSPKAARLAATLTGVDPEGTMFLQVTGTGITPVGGSCQSQVAVPADFASNVLEAYRAIGDVGQPLFENGWTNKGQGFASAAFLKDSLGIVHLRGTLNGPTGQVAFTLPAGYRPAATLFMSLAVGGVVTGNLLIANTGEVIPFCSVASNCTAAGNGAAGIDGLTFVAEWPYRPTHRRARFL